ncbi:MAG: hypothetical protein AAFV25_19615 [Bacteroidota bacterium]
MKRIIFTSLCCLYLISSFAQNKSENIQKQFELGPNSANKTLVIANINGHIKVEGHASSSVQMNIQSQYEDSPKDGQKMVELHFRETADSLIAYFTVNCQSNSNGNSGPGIWKYYGMNGKHCKAFDDFQFDFAIKVPQNINLWMATINEGDISVKNVAGTIEVENINGSISLQQIAGQTKARTINGNLDIRYADNPESDSRYYSLNGDINAYYQKGLAATLSFKSFNGEFFTDVSDVSSLPSQVEKSESNKGKTTYKINEKSLFSLRNGQSPHLDFETFNGNVYLREM